MPHEGERISTLFGKQVLITNNFWHRHSLREIFLEEVYKFTACNTQPRIIDCGANIGLSVIYFKRLYPGAKVIAFEPDADIYRKLNENLLMFGLHDVMVYEKAVWNANTNLKFHAAGSLSGAVQSDIQTAETNQSFKNVKAIRLSEWLNEPTDFLKIDIEGAEFEVLTDCETKLGNVSNIFIEYHSTPGKKQCLHILLEILSKAGFRAYIREAWNNLPYPYQHKMYKPVWDMQLNIFGYRI
jgi:FkbM family methyltransferase